LNWIYIIIGLLLVFVGRGLFWLFVACIGPWVEMALFFALVVVGMVFQAKVMTGERCTQ
jgi:hypothetical protein